MKKSKTKNPNHNNRKTNTGEKSAIIRDFLSTDHLFLKILLMIFISCGGFYAAVNSLMAVSLCLYLLYMYKSKKPFSYTPGLLDYSVYALIAAYIVGIITGIDKGMALMGASKLFCLLPFTLIIMQLTSEEKKKLVRLIPFTGVLSVVLCTFLLITPLSEYVFIARRMSGFMGYANTFAFLMLAGILCEFFYGKKNPVIMVILSIGLFWSGSRTVFVMFIAAVLFIIIKHLLIADHYNIKHIIFAIITFLVIVIVSLLIPATSGIFRRLTDISVNSSTFQGRLLYMQDALPLIKRFPFGLGSYGYSYVGRTTATGLYNVKYIHNCILQLAADTGIIPAVIVILLFAVTWIKNRNYTVLFLFSHALMDIDFEYVAIFFVFIIIIEGYGKKTVAENAGPNVTGTQKKATPIPAVICCIFALIGVLPGMSNTLFLLDDPVAALKIYPLNTEAREVRMENSYDLEEIISDATYLTDHNEYNVRGYQMLGTLAYLNGDAEKTVYYLTKEIALVPYTGSEYRSFASYLADLASKANDAGDTETYAFCVKNIRILYETMKEKEKNISFFGSRISEQPALYLDSDAMSLISDSPD